MTIPAGTRVIADLHLDPAGDARLDRFEAWLEALEAPRLVILGDLFEVWVGPAQARMVGARRVIEALHARHRKGTALDIVPGNRDFLLGSDFERSTGATVHPHGFLGGGGAGDDDVLFVHGDELCTLDVGYQRLKRVVRSLPARALARTLPLAVARRAAARLRKASRSSVARKPAPEKAMQPDACRELLEAAGARTLMCGHAHEYRDERIADGKRWIVLGAWGGTSDELSRTAEGDWIAHTSRSR